MAFPALASTGQADIDLENSGVQRDLEDGVLALSPPAADCRLSATQINLVRACLFAATPSTEALSQIPVANIVALYDAAELVEYTPYLVSLASGPEAADAEADALRATVDRAYLLITRRFCDYLPAMFGPVMAPAADDLTVLAQDIPDLAAGDWPADAAATEAPPEGPALWYDASGSPIDLLATDLELSGTEQFSLWSVFSTAGTRTLSGLAVQAKLNAAQGNLKVTNVPATASVYAVAAAAVHITRRLKARRRLVAELIEAMYAEAGPGRDALASLINFQRRT